MTDASPPQPSARQPSSAPFTRLGALVWLLDNGLDGRRDWAAMPDEEFYREFAIVYDAATRPDCEGDHA